MKYFVIVNQKYLVTVDADTAGGAEHKILDDIYYGIKGCQAFNTKELKTDAFRDMVENCSTISFNELLEQSKLYKTTLDYIDELTHKCSKCDDKILYNNEMITKCKSNIEEAENDKLDLKLRIKELHNKLSQIIN